MPTPSSSARHCATSTASRRNYCRRDAMTKTAATPAALRARLFYLYEFTAQHSRAVLDDKASVEVLADINMAVMRGLRGDGGSK